MPAITAWSWPSTPSSSDPHGQRDARRRRRHRAARPAQPPPRRPRTARSGDRPCRVGRARAETPRPSPPAFASTPITQGPRLSGGAGEDRSAVTGPQIDGHPIGAGGQVGELADVHLRDPSAHHAVAWRRVYTSARDRELPRDPRWPPAPHPAARDDRHPRWRPARTDARAGGPRDGLPPRGPRSGPGLPGRRGRRPSRPRHLRRRRRGPAARRASATSSPTSSSTSPPTSSSAIDAVRAGPAGSPARSSSRRTGSPSGGSSRRPASPSRRGERSGRPRSCERPRPPTRSDCRSGSRSRSAATTAAARSGSPTQPTLDDALARLGRAADRGRSSSSASSTSRPNCRSSSPRGTRRRSATFPIARNVHEDGVLVESVAPAPFDRTSPRGPRDRPPARRPAMDLVGTLTAELFLLARWFARRQRAGPARPQQRPLDDRRRRDVPVRAAHPGDLRARRSGRPTPLAPAAMVNLLGTGSAATGAARRRRRRPRRPGCPPPPLRQATRLRGSQDGARDGDRTSVDDGARVAPYGAGPPCAGPTRTGRSRRDDRRRPRSSAARRHRRRQPLRLPDARGGRAPCSTSSASRRSCGSSRRTGRRTTSSATRRRPRARASGSSSPGAGGAAHLPGCSPPRPSCRSSACRSRRSTSAAWTPCSRSSRCRAASPSRRWPSAMRRTPASWRRRSSPSATRPFRSASPPGARRQTEAVLADPSNAP